MEELFISFTYDDDDEQYGTGLSVSIVFSQFWPSIGTVMMASTVDESMQCGATPIESGFERG